MKFENLSAEEQLQFLRFPVYIALLAANANGITDEKEKQAAIEFNHMKTYTSHPLLRNFYALADERYAELIQQLDGDLPKGKEQRDLAIKKELSNLERILEKFDADYIAIMHKSMDGFRLHVSKAHRNILASFIFPLPIKGIH